MKTGADALGVLQPGSMLVENALSALGLGWLGALILLSGSLSILLLGLTYPAVWSALWSLQTAVTRSRTRLAAFTLGVLLPGADDRARGRDRLTG